jgi:hypothetical protein
MSNLYYYILTSSETIKQTKKVDDESKFCPKEGDLLRYNKNK